MEKIASKQVYEENFISNKDGSSENMIEHLRGMSACYSTGNDGSERIKYMVPSSYGRSDNMSSIEFEMTIAPSGMTQFGQSQKVTVSAIAKRHDHSGKVTMTHSDIFHPGKTIRNPYGTEENAAKLERLAFQIADSVFNTDKVGVGPANYDTIYEKTCNLLKIATNITPKISPNEPVGRRLGKANPYLLSWEGGNLIKTESAVRNYIHQKLGPGRIKVEKLDSPDPHSRYYTQFSGGTMMTPDERKVLLKEFGYDDETVPTGQIRVHKYGKNDIITASTEEGSLVLKLKRPNKAHTRIKVIDEDDDTEIFGGRVIDALVVPDTVPLADWYQKNGVHLC